MSYSFLGAVRQGKNQWWRYLISIVVLFCGLFMGAFVAQVVAIVVLVTSGRATPGMLSSPVMLENAMNQLLKTPSVTNYVINNIPFVFLLLSIALAVKLVHRRPFRSLISGNTTFQFGRFMTGFGVWFGLLAVLLGISYFQTPQDFVLTFSPVKWGMLVAVALILTPIQIAAEELLCRAYWMQGLSLLTSNRWILITLPSLLFALGHFSNPEMARDGAWMAFSYWGLGVFLAALTLRDNRLELALGIHAAQNLFVLLFANTEDSVIKTPSVFTIQDPGDPKLGFVAFLFQAAIFSWIVFGRKPSKAHPTVG